MRDDFAQLLIDTYRVGDSTTYKKFRAQARNTRDSDDLPSRQKMNPYILHWGDSKEFGDNLNCLKRYLHKQVGRPWDNVMSDVHAALQRGRGSTAAKRHVLQHIDGYVSKNPMFDGKVPLTRHGSEDWGFYVDKKGFLRYRDRSHHRPYRGFASDVIWVDNHRGYELHDGKWFYVEYERVPKVTSLSLGVRKPLHDVFLGEGEVNSSGFFFEKGKSNYSVDLAQPYGRIGNTPRYAARKRRATDKEVVNARKRYR